MTRFSRVSLAERLALLQTIAGLSQEESNFLEAGSLPEPGLSDVLIENSIGNYMLPLGIVPEVIVNKKSYTVPLVTEETSVIAALQKTVRWIKHQKGTIEAESLSPQLMIGQIQIPRVKDLPRLRVFLATKAALLTQAAHQGPARMMAERGGGIKEYILRELPRPDGSFMAVIHVHIDVQEAMGANLINQVCEFLKPLIAAETDEILGMAILSNLADQRLTRVRVCVPDVSPDLGGAIEEASLFAQLDPYRAVTHNKGLLNGIDGVAVATGNDWRAIEAALHAYAAHTGTYRGLSTWSFRGGLLEGVFEGPLPVGCVGGITGVHPGARLSHKILGIHNATELAQVIAAVGILQNLGALRALVSGGIVQGHMALHLDNLLVAAGASSGERGALKREVRRSLKEKGYVSTPEILNLIEKGRQFEEG